MLAIEHDSTDNVIEYLGYQGNMAVASIRYLYAVYGVTMRHHGYTSRENRVVAEVLRARARACMRVSVARVISLMMCVFAE